jgi:hypothetical protein
MIKKKTTRIIIIITILFFGFLANQVYAALNLKNAFDSNAGVPLGDVAAQTDYYTTISLPVFIGQIVAIILSILGILFIFLMVYGGYLWMTAMGNETQATKAKDLIQAAVIGLIIMLAAYAISYFVTSSLVSPFMKPQKTQAPLIQSVPNTVETPAPESPSGPMILDPTPGADD